MVKWLFVGNHYQLFEKKPSMAHPPHDLYNSRIPSAREPLLSFLKFVQILMYVGEAVELPGGDVWPKSLIGAQQLRLYAYIERRTLCMVCMYE